MNSMPDDRSIRCTVEGADKLPAELGGAAGICAAITNAAAAPAAPDGGVAVAVRVLSPYAAIATVTGPDGRTMPDVEVSISDRPLNSRSISMIADAVAAQIASLR